VNPQRADQGMLNAMLAKAEQKLASARASLEAGYHDDAASRAYYAAFHAISAALAVKGLSYSSYGQAHP
jgi:uncharacterized protein (UPF0332 family)